jgi:hypothetical protein
MKPQNIAALLDMPIDAVEDALRELSSLDDITSTEHAEELYRKATGGSENKRLIMVKWLSLCTNLKQAQEAYDTTTNGSEDERLAMVRCLSFCTTSEQVRRAYHTAPAGSEAERLTIQKLAEMPDEE